MSAKIVLSSGTIALCFSVTPLLADVSAEDYWAAIAAVAEASGATINSQVSVDGNVTTYGNISLQYELPMDVGSFGFYVGSMYVTENRNGTLSVTYPDTIPLQINGRIEDAAFYARFSFDLDGSTLVVSGNPDDLELASSTDSIRITLDDFRFKDRWDTVSLADLESGYLVGTFTDLEEVMRISFDDLIRIEAETSSGEFALDYDFGVDGGTASGSEYLGGSEGYYSISLIPGGFNLLELNNAIQNGLAFEFGSSSFDSRSIQNIASPYAGSSATLYSVEAQTGELRFDKNGVLLSGDAEGISIDFEEDTMGFGVGAKIDSVGVGLQMPIMASSAPQTTSLRTNLTGFRLDESAVGMFQMMATLTAGESIPPALLQYIDDPISLEYDLSADVLLGFDLLDFEGYDTFNSYDPPIDVENITINRLYFDFAEMQLDADGAFEVDLDDFDTYGDFPKMVGGASAKLTGLNAILDTLIDTGLISPDELMPVRMGIGMFTTVSGDDELTSTVELTEEGQVFVNGQRMK